MSMVGIGEAGGACGRRAGGRLGTFRGFFRTLSPRQGARRLCKKRSNSFPLPISSDTARLLRNGQIEFCCWLKPAPSPRILPFADDIVRLYLDDQALLTFLYALGNVTIID